MKNEPLNLNDLIKSLNDNIRDMLSLTNDHFADVLYKNLKESVISAIRNTIYVSSDSEKLIEEFIVTPESIINLSRYINLDEVLYVDSKYLYKICIDDNEEFLMLNLTGFTNHFPDFVITNLSHFHSVYNIGRSGLIEYIESYDKYLYYMLTHSYRNDNDISIKPKFKDNTWEDVIYASENNCVPDTWGVGDEIDITLSGKYNETITLQIWDLNHYDKTDNTGKAGILFGMKNLMKTTQYMNSSSTNAGGWNSSYMRNIVMKDIYESIPENIRSHIKEVYTYANTGNYSQNESKGLLSKDKVFIPGLSEIYNEWEEQNKTETGQYLIPIFRDKNNRIKKLNNGIGSEARWWTRSPHYGSNFGFCRFYNDGYYDRNFANCSFGVCVCFNI